MDNKSANPKMRKRRKVCQFCVDKATIIDYKDTAKLRRFLSERSKILPRRTTGVCAMEEHFSLIDPVKNKDFFTTIIDPPLKYDDNAIDYYKAGLKLKVVDELHKRGVDTSEEAMNVVLGEEPLDPTLVEFDDSEAW